MRLKSLSGLLMSLSALVMISCGGGGGSTSNNNPAPTAPTTLAVVKVATSGTLPSGKTIGGIMANVIATPATGLSIVTADVISTGAGSGALIAPNIQANVVLGVISAAGIQTGEFATLTYHVAAGSLPQTGDFTIAAGASVIDAATGATIPGITVFIQSVTLR